MRVTIDLEVCSGHGRCYALCPEVFEEDDEGYPLLASEVIPPEYREVARAAERNCPERAIKIRDPDSSESPDRPVLPSSPEQENAS